MKNKNQTSNLDYLATSGDFVEEYHPTHKAPIDFIPYNPDKKSPSRLTWFGYGLTVGYALGMVVAWLLIHWLASNI